VLFVPRAGRDPGSRLDLEDADVVSITDGFASGNGRPHGRSIFREELGRLRAVYEEGDRLAKSGESAADRARGEDMRREAEASFWAASVELGDLWLLLFRHAINHRKDTVRAYLMLVLGDDFRELADYIALVEGRP
jgi:hypothetical protein